MKRNIQCICNPNNIGNCFYSYNLSDIHYMNVDYMRKQLLKVKYEYNKGKYIIHNTEIETNENKYKRRNEVHSNISSCNHLHYKYNNKYNYQLKQETVIQSLKYSKRKPFMKVNKDLLEMTKKVNNKKELLNIERDANDKDKEINELNTKVEEFKKENELLKNKHQNESELIKENEMLKIKHLELEKELGGLKEENELLEKDLKIKSDKVCLLDNKLLELNEVVYKKDEEIQLLKNEINTYNIDNSISNVNGVHIIKEDNNIETHDNINNDTQYHNEEEDNKDIHITNINNNELPKYENNENNSDINNIICSCLVMFAS